MHTLAPTSVFSPWSRPYAIASDARLLALTNTRRPRESQAVPAPSSGPAISPAPAPVTKSSPRD
ncbi:hypothetical protein [Botrimarina mediterranea]|uniref:hypothetical protein n=1 Tax=Botrimarina mediterranea TaxID=2528022 RepID=UPI001188AC6C|nr:hypothetical protein K2D_09700 [Planctomycetes bacterium K2D]